METTSQINFKIIYFGFLVTGLIVLLFSNGITISKPGSKVRPVSQTDCVKFIYRGIPCGHKFFDDAANGIARPYGGHSIPSLHRDGDNNSQFTSWSTDYTVAYHYATQGINGPCNGIILMKKVDLSGNRFVDVNTIPGGDAFNEKEIFVKGMINGCIPVLVKPGMDKNAISTLLKNAI